MKIQINTVNYVGWTSVQCYLSSTDRVAHNVVLKNRSSSGGQLAFKKGASGAVSDTLSLSVPADGSSVHCYIAGKFDRNTGRGFPSTADKDCIISVVDSRSNEELGNKALMVRVRKNANKITAAERDRFLAAVVKLSQQGKYIDFQNMHTDLASSEIHHRSCFLPWHRAYLLDFERKLQEIDPSVTIPYWKFDAPAPNLFTSDFMGIPDSTGAVDFSNTNPMVNLRPVIFGQGAVRIRRRPKFNTATQWSSDIIKNNENATLALGNVFATFDGSNRTDGSTRTGGFCMMENDPHGQAHISFTGPISNLGLAPADPLFYLIHSNVDRLWAKWQWINDRFDSNSTSSYPHQGSGNHTRKGEHGIGNYINDTLWPWNGDFSSPRPTTGPNVRFPNSLTVNVPGQTPDLKSMFDYQGQLNLTSNLGFAYEDVPYDHQ
jgi:tyrosinase